jgi:hypothetical protein
MYDQQTRSARPYLWDNTAVPIVKSIGWEQLHQLIGTDYMRFLLLRSDALYFRVRDGAFQQLAGTKLMAAAAPIASKRWSLPDAPEINVRRMLYNDRYVKRAGCGLSVLMIRKKDAYDTVRAMYAIPATMRLREFRMLGELMHRVFLRNVNVK